MSCRTAHATQRIEEHDIPLLEHLTDIKVVPNAEAGTGFSLQFFFSQNEWFTDAVCRPAPIRAASPHGRC